MNHIKRFESFNSDSELNEGLKDFLIGGLIALSSIGAAKAQDSDQTVTSPTTRTEYQIHQMQLDKSVLSKLNKYHKMVMDQSSNFKKSEDGKYHITKAGNFVASSKTGTGYNKKNIFIVFGEESKPDAQVSLNLKDDGVISVMIGDERTTKDMGDGAWVTKAGTQLMSQTEIRKGDIGYEQALELVNSL